MSHLRERCPCNSSLPRARARSSSSTQRGFFTRRRSAASMLACGSTPAISSSAPSITMLAARLSPSSSARLRERKREHMHVVAHAIGGKLVAVVDHPSAGAHAFVELAQRGLVHRHQHIGRGHQRRIDGLRATAARGSSKCPSASQAHRTAATKPPARHRVRPRPALRRAARRPARQSRRCAPGDRSPCRAATAAALPSGKSLFGNAKNARKLIERGLRRHWPSSPPRQCRSFVRSQNTPSGNVFSITSRTQCCASTGVIFQMVGHGDSTSISEKPNPRTWFSRPRRDGPRRLRNLLVVAQAHALNVDGRLQACSAVRSRAADSLQSRRCGRSESSCSSGPAAWWARPARRSCCRWRC